MAALRQCLLSPVSGETWDDVRGVAGFLSSICRQILELRFPYQRNERRSYDAALSGLSKTEDAAVAFARLPDLDDGGRVSDAYWQAGEALRKLRPLIDDTFFWQMRQWKDTFRCSKCHEGRQSDGTYCAFCHGTMYLGPQGPAILHGVRAGAVTAEFIQQAAVNHPGDRRAQDAAQLRRLQVTTLEAEQAGVKRSVLLHQEWIWRFFAAGRRMPLSEQTLYAFQAAWEIGHYDFARNIAAQGYGAITSEQAAKLRE